MGVTDHPCPTQQDAYDHFATILGCEVTPRDLLEPGDYTGVVVRQRAAYEEGHIEGAVHLPLSTIRKETVPPGLLVVVGQDDAQTLRGALVLCALGAPTKALRGGMAAWPYEVA